MNQETEIREENEYIGFFTATILKWQKLLLYVWCWSSQRQAEIKDQQWRGYHIFLSTPSKFNYEKLK